MKNSYGIYYLIILFLVIMMFIPPLFRLLIPKEGASVAPQTQTVNILTCNQTKNIGAKNIAMATTTTYLNTTLASVKFAYTKMDTPDKKDSFISTFETLKKIANVKYDETENSILFNYRNYDFYNEVSLNIYSRDINTQKQYYESLGFSCTITKK